MPVSTATAARKKVTAKRPPTKKAPAKKTTAARAPRKPKLPTPPWRSWSLPPFEERDDETWYGPHPDSAEYREFQEYVRKWRLHPDFDDAFAELRIPKSDQPVPSETSKAKPTAAETSSDLVYVKPDPGSMFALVQDAQRRYQSEPPRMYVILREIDDKSMVLATDLYDRGTVAEWTNELEHVRLFGASDAAEHLRILDRQANKVDQLDGLLKYSMVPADMLLFVSQRQRADDQVSSLFLQNDQPSSFTSTSAQVRQRYEKLIKLRVQG